MSDTTNNTTPTPDSNPTPPPATPQGNPGGQSTGQEEIIQFTPAQLKARLERDWQTENSRFLAEIGVDSREALKALLADAKARKDAEMSEVEKLQAQLQSEQAKAKKAQDDYEALRLQRIADSRDSLIKELAKDAGAVDVEDVLLNMQKDSDALAKMVNEDGTPNKKAIESAINAVKAAKAHLFSAQVPGVPSNKGGTPPKPDATALEAAKNTYMKRLRRG